MKQNIGDANKHFIKSNRIINLKNRSRDESKVMLPIETRLLKKELELENIC